MESGTSRTSPSTVAGRGGRLATLLVVALALTACQPQAPGDYAVAAVDTTAIVASVDSVRVAYQEAVGAEDWQALGSMTTEDAVLVTAGGGDWDAFRAAAGDAPFPPGGTVEIESAEVGVLSADWAYDMGSATVTWTPEGADAPRTASDTYLVLLRRTADGWKLHREVASSRPMPGGGE